MNQGFVIVPYLSWSKSVVSTPTLCKVCP